MSAGDGKDTRGRILDSAAHSFAERGIRATTVKEICDDAGANVAAVNYYFGSKERLVEEVWQETFDAMQRHHGNPHVHSLPALERLKALVRSQLQAVMDDGPGGRFPKIVFRAISEFDQDQVEILFRRHLEPRMNALLGAVREVLGPDAGDLEVRSCALAIHSPCVHLNIARHKGHGPIFRGAAHELNPDTIIETLTAFIVGGVTALRSGHVSRRDPDSEARQ